MTMPETTQVEKWLALLRFPPFFPHLFNSQFPLSILALWPPIEVRVAGVVASLPFCGFELNIGGLAATGAMERICERFEHARLSRNASQYNRGIK